MYFSLKFRLKSWYVFRICFFTFAIWNLNSCMVCSYNENLVLYCFPFGHFYSYAFFMRKCVCVTVYTVTSYETQVVKCPCVSFPCEILYFMELFSFKVVKCFSFFLSLVNYLVSSYVWSAFQVIEVYCSGKGFLLFN